MTADIVVNAVSGLMKFWVAGESKARHTISCGTAAVGPGFGHNGMCPPGNYGLGDPEACAPPEDDGNVPYGYWFTPLRDIHGLWEAEGRGGIGVHGGGSASPDPFAPNQGLYATEGCIRLLNADNNNIFVPFVQFIGAENITFSIYNPAEALA